MTSPIPQCVYLAISPFAPSHQQRFLRGFSVRLVTPASPCIHHVYTGHLLRCLSRPQRSGCKVLLFRATAQCDCITDDMTEVLRNATEPLQYNLCRNAVTGLFSFLQSGSLGCYQHPSGTFLNLMLLDQVRQPHLLRS